MRALAFVDRVEMSRCLRTVAHAPFLAEPCVLVHTDGPGGLFVVLSPALGDDAVGGWYPTAARWTDGGALTLGKKDVHGVAWRENLESPLMAVQPRPWRREPPVRAAAVFLPDEAAYGEDLRAALTLGQERMRAATLKDGRVLILVESPSYYLLQRWEERADRELYWRAQYASVYLPWGHEHPLAKRLRGLELAGELFFAKPGGGWERLAEPELKDVYEGLHLDLPGQVRAVVQAAGEIPEVEVALRWGFRPIPADGAVWSLPDPGDEHVERLLLELPEESLAGLQLAVLETGEGKVRYLVRRLARTAAGGRTATVELPGEAFAPYAGYGNLFLPVRRRLEPPVRADRFRTLFGLVPGEMVFVEPEDGAQEGEEPFLVWRVPDRAFKPLGSVVEYRVRAAQERLEEIRRASVFDFEPLEYTPERAASVEAGGAEPRATKVEVEEPEAGGEEELGEAAPAPKRRVKRPAKRAQPEKVDLEPVPESAGSGAGPDLEEQEGEDSALSEGGVVAWGRLAILKARRRKWSDAFFAAEEALWLAEDEEARGTARDGLRDLLEHYLGVASLEDDARPEAVREAASQSSERREAAARWAALALQGVPEGEPLREALSAAYADLRGARMRRKARWLAWAEVLALSGDVAEEERQREAILGSLARRGLEPDDRPSFLGRFLRSRAGLEEWMEQVDLPALLELLGRGARSIAAGPFRAEAQALVLRTAIEADREGRGTDRMGEFEALLAGDEVSMVARSHHAGALSYGSAEDASLAFRQVLAELSASENPPDRLFVHLFENAIEVLRELEPTRAARVLPEVAGRLVELGARDELAQVSRELLATREVRGDIFLVERAAAALQVALTPEGYGPEDLERLAESILTARPDERFDILYLDLIEDVVVGLGADFVERLEAKVTDEVGGDLSSGAGAYPGLILGACRLKLLAEEGRTAEGLRVIRDALGACWALEDPLRARAMGRYIRAVAHLGNVPEGGAILRDIIQQAYARGRDEIEEFYRSEILGAVAWAAGGLGDPGMCLEIIEKILEGVEGKLESAGDDVSLLFEVLSKGIEVLLDLGEFRRGGDLVERIEQVVRARVEGHDGVQRGPWYFLHRARVVCARALLYMGRDMAGAAALRGALADFTRVSSLDRTDLLEEAAAVLPYVDGVARREALEAMVSLMEETEDIGEYDRRRRSEVVMALAAAVRPGADAYRREQSRWDALEARSIRRRVATHHPSAGKAGWSG
jgi:hypothetical protein